MSAKYRRNGSHHAHLFARARLLQMAFTPVSRFSRPFSCFLKKVDGFVVGGLVTPDVRKNLYVPNTRYLVKHFLISFCEGGSNREKKSGDELGEIL